MSQYTSYYLYQKYEKRGDQPFIPSYPQVYSIDGDGTMPLSVKNDNDANCGYTGDTPTTQYRWVNLPISQDYVCDDCPEAQYRWVETSGYICNGTTKYNREVQQVSEDGGQTWTNTSNYRQGSTVIEYNSADCGYVPPIDPIYRWVETDEYRCEYSEAPIDPIYRWVETSGYFCISTIKYAKEIQQVSYDGGQTWEDTSNYRQGSRVIEYDSADCGYVERWVETSGYICNGTTKYNREMKQISEDGGDTWMDTSNYRQGSTVIEYNSEDCGYTNPYASQYLTIESLEDNNEIRWIATENKIMRIISASTDNGATWTQYSTGKTIATLDKGEKVLIKGNNTAYSEYVTAQSYIRSTHFLPYKSFNVYGNIMSLVYGDDFVNKKLLTKSETFSNIFWRSKIVSAKNLILPSTTLTNNCYSEMFLACSGLTEAPQLPATTLGESCYHNMFNGCTSLTEVTSTLPATALTTNCYNGMFNGCTSLTTAPSLSATTLAESCCSGMFGGCKSLTTAPELRATTMQKQCYQSMFASCTSLIKAPELIATTLADYCYLNMFYGCASLNYIKMLATDISATDCLIHWVDGVSSSGIFVKASSMTSLPSGVNGIPNGWTVLNA